MTLPVTQRFAAPKELPDLLNAQGFPGFDQRACREIIKAMRDDGAPVMRKKYARPADVCAWLVAHPNWTPYAIRPSAQATGLFAL
jgi:hypothetical protein